MTSTGQPTVEAQIRVPKTDLPPEAANWFHIGIMNLDVQMLVGYIDPQQAGEFAQATKNRQKNVSPLTPMVTHRVMMSMTGFAQLRAQIHEMERRMRDAGIQFFDETVPKASND